MMPETIVNAFMTVALNYQRQFSEDETAAIQSHWMDTFKGKSDELFETAIRLVMLNNPAKYGYFPGVGDIQNSIDELLREESTKPKAVLDGFLLASSRADPTDYGHNCADLIRRQLNKEKTRGDPLFLQIKTETVDNLRSFAKSIFPAISDELIWQNENPFTEAKLSAEMCSRCHWMPGECSMHGQQTRLLLQPNGYLLTNLTDCAKKQILGNVKAREYEYD